MCFQRRECGGKGLGYRGVNHVWKVHLWRARERARSAGGRHGTGGMRHATCLARQPDARHIALTIAFLTDSNASRPKKSHRVPFRPSPHPRTSAMRSLRGKRARSPCQQTRSTARAAAPPYLPSVASRPPRIPWVNGTTAARPAAMIVLRKARSPSSVAAFSTTPMKTSARYRPALRPVRAWAFPATERTGGRR